MFNVPFYILVLIGMTGIITGIVVGFIATDSQLWSVLNVTFHAVVRVAFKSVIRTFNPAIDTFRVQRDKDFIVLPDKQKSALADPTTIEVVTEFKYRLQKHFGPRLKAVYLFGSRVRGDHGPHSDVDVAVFLDGSFDCNSTFRKEMVRQTGELLIKHGLYIQPRVLDGKSLEVHEAYSQSQLVRTILSYGILI